MRRQLAVALTVLLLSSLWPPVALEVPAQTSTIIIDRLNPGAYARVDHTGALVTSATVSVATDNINVFHQSTIRHVSSVSHVLVTQSERNRLAFHLTDAICLTCSALIDHTGALKTTASVTLATDNVNVFHQSTIRHVSSVSHVLVTQSERNRLAFHQTDSLCLTCSATISHAGAQATYVTNVAGTAVTVTGTALDVNCTGCAAASVVNVNHISAMQHVSIVDLPRWAHLAAAQSGSWTVQAAHQGGQWNTAHVTAVSHVLVTQSDRNRLGMHVTDATCLTCRMRVDHYDVLVTQPHISGALRTWQVSQCGTSATLSIATNTNRRDLWVMNRGNGNIYIGYGVTGHVALTTANGWPLHATASAITSTARHSTALSTVYLPNYQGPLACIADLAGQTLQVMEILR